MFISTSHSVISEQVFCLQVCFKYQTGTVLVCVCLARFPVSTHSILIWHAHNIVSVFLIIIRLILILKKGYSDIYTICYLVVLNTIISSTCIRLYSACTLRSKLVSLPLHYITKGIPTWPKAADGTSNFMIILIISLHH